MLIPMEIVQFRKFMEFCNPELRMKHYCYTLRCWGRKWNNFWMRASATLFKQLTDAISIKTLNSDTSTHMQASEKSKAVQMNFMCKGSFSV